MLVIIVVGVFLGYKLDEFYPNKYSLFTILLSLFSIGLSLYYTIRQVKQHEKFFNKR